MSEEATLSSILTTPFKLTDVMEPGPCPYEALEGLHPILHEKLVALQKREEVEKLTPENTLWEFTKLFVEADVNPYALFGVL